MVEVVKFSEIVAKKVGPSLVSFTFIPAEAKTTIISVILNDEGGWKLTDDGGGDWTYGGMTSTKLEEYFPPLTYDQIDATLDDVNETQCFQKLIQSIYYQDFYLAIQVKYFSARPPGILDPCYFSCAINCGLAGFDTIWKNTKVARPGRKQFLGAWIGHYFDLLAGNPKFGKYIHGWVNRVWKYV